MTTQTPLFARLSTFKDDEHAPDVRAFDISEFDTKLVTAVEWGQAVWQQHLWAGIAIHHLGVLQSGK